MLHSVAFAPRETLKATFSTSREALLAHNISAYSLVGLAREATLMTTEEVSLR
jgi:enoyl-[acyl-carrier protein] reductase I